VVFGPLLEPADHEHAGEGNDHAAVRPVGWHEIAGLAPLMALIVLIGVVPGPFLDRIRPSSGEIDKNLQSQRGSMTLAVATTTILERNIISAPRNAPRAPQGKRR
jgi:NADH-quinone oxidoreductase subunit M